MSECPIPTKLALKRDEALTITWPDGEVVVYPIAYLRANCPCAACKTLRESQRKSRLTVFQSGYTSGPITVQAAHQVGNYALQIEWSDKHASGIYSYTYLMEITPPQNKT